MLIGKIVETINTRLAGELFNITEMVTFLDSTIDDINTRLNTTFPVFSELELGQTEYNYFPDKYIRSVVIPGAIFKFYVMDEEGAEGAPKYEEEYRTNLFYMERDYLALVPEEYIGDMAQGTYAFDESHPLYDRGLEYDGGCFNL